MGENLLLRQKCQAYLDGEIREDEFVGWFVKEASYQWSTTFWCQVIRLKSKHDHVGDHIESKRLGGENDG